MNFIAKIALQVVAYPSEPKEGSSKPVQKEKYIYLSRMVEIPFPPFNGLNIQLALQNDQKAMQDYEKAINSAKDMVAGIFRVEETSYQEDNGQIRLKCYYATYTRHLRNVVEQLVYGYGFRVVD